MTKPTCRPLPRGDVKLLGGVFNDRFHVNRSYLASLKSEALLQSYYYEAGLRSAILHCRHFGATPDDGTALHWGWESPTCELRGFFLGHWLSAAAQIIATTGDAELKLRADGIVNELAVCQEKNGRGWVSPIPEKYMEWLAQGKPTWAPHYIHHKTLMGLHDIYVLTGNEMAMAIAGRFAEWFHRWSDGFSREQMDNILDVETGGMLEAWADLYGTTGDARYLDLLERYNRERLFGPLVDGRDVLTNMHANTTIPEAQGAARAYEVTGDERWRSVVEAYWRWAVAERGFFCTGGQTSGEIWTPPQAFAARRGDKNQEHCTVYNMIRLAEYLFRWTGKAEYADYIERNLYNGILAQQHPRTGMITYCLPLEAGAQKHWGSPTNDFWCCHGTLVQAHAMHNSLIYYSDADGFRVAQYIPSEMSAEWRGVKVQVRQEFDPRNGHVGAVPEGSPWPGAVGRPSSWAVRMTVSCAAPVEFRLLLRLPAWLSDRARIWINGQEQRVLGEHGAYEGITRLWHEDTVHIELPKAVTLAPIPDEPETVAFLDGPVVLAGLCDREIALQVGDMPNPAWILARDNEREWGNWLHGYRTVGQPEAIRFKPLFEIVDEPFTLYFPLRHEKPEPGTER
jgi:DUF1680 family protein